MRYRIHTIITKATRADKASRAYDYFIMISALLSIVPLMFKEEMPWMLPLDTWTVYILFFDYILRWITADYECRKPGRSAFFLYPFRPMALMVLLSLLPSLDLLPQSLRILRLFRFIAIFRYSKNFIYIANVFRREVKTLLTVLMIALGYIFLSALLMFVTEPDTFNDFFAALYWATTALTTVGYGDVFPHSDLGRLISMISSLFGIAIIALPAGVVTAGFMQELEEDRKRRDSASKAHQAEIAAMADEEAVGNEQEVKLNA